MLFWGATPLYNFKKANEDTDAISCIYVFTSRREIVGAGHCPSGRVSGGWRSLRMMPRLRHVSMRRSIDLRNTDDWGACAPSGGAAPPAALTNAQMR
jgi:hypothetical protein